MKTFDELHVVLPVKYIQTVRSRVPDRDDQTFARQLTECLKYLCIVSMTRGRRIPVTPEVDDIWHELIVQTSSYSRLCQMLPGRQFIHHESITPVEYAGRVGDLEFAREFIQWVPDYFHSFGPFHAESAQHWTVCQFLTEEMNLSLREINHLGSIEEPAAQLPFDSPWRTLSSEKVPEWISGAKKNEAPL